MLPKKFVTIYGAGISGLTLAYRLKQLGIDFHLHEKRQLGGKISTRPTKWGPLESAASTLYMNGEAEQLVQELNLPYFCAQRKLKRWVWHPEGPLAAPGARAVASLLFRSFKQVPVINQGSTVEDILLPLFGRKLTDELLSPSLQGIYTSQSRELHFLSLFPWAENKKFSNYLDFFYCLKKELHNKRANSIKGSISFPGGMNTLVERLADEVQAHIQSTVKEDFELKDNTVICTNASEAASLLKNSAPDVAQLLSEIEYRPVTSYAFFLKQQLPQLKSSFGMLIPQKYNSPVLGVIHQSEIFPENYQAHCYTVVCQGILSEEDVQKELELRLKGFHRENVLESSLKSWQQGLPIYNFKRHRTIQKLQRSLVNHPGLMLFGNYTNGISLRAIIEQTRKFSL